MNLFWLKPWLIDLTPTFYVAIVYIQISSICYMKQEGNLQTLWTNSSCITQDAPSTILGYRCIIAHVKFIKEWTIELSLLWELISTSSNWTSEMYVYNSFHPIWLAPWLLCIQVYKSMSLTYCKFETTAIIGIFSALQKLSLKHSAILDFTIGDLALKYRPLEDLSLQNCYVHGDFFVGEDDIMMRTIKLLN